MPSVVSTDDGRDVIIKFTNGRVLRGDALVSEDVWFSPLSGKIVRSQLAFFDDHLLPSVVIDLRGRIVSPGFIDCQLNGAFGFNFSTLLDDMSQYGKRMRDLNRKLVQTGVTSYVPTLTSQTKELYHKVLPFLRPLSDSRAAEDGAESLGAHVEGPFLNPSKNGIHNVNVLREAYSFGDLEDMYGAENVNPGRTVGPMAVKMITAAPELGNMAELIPEMTSRGIVFSLGHSEATYEQAAAAVGKGASMITHLFNAMRPLHHRNPGIFGVLGEAKGTPRPCFGIIADGIHLHPTTIKIAFNAHPDGFILVTDAMHMVGLPDGPYEWTNGDERMRLVKNGKILLLENSNTIAGA